MGKNIDNLNVNSRKTFAQFVKLLSEDYKSAPQDWEHVTIESFLEAISQYAEDIQGYYDNTKLDIDADIPNWKTFSDILRGALIYE